jgi:hypothetical protein
MAPIKFVRGLLFRIIVAVVGIGFADSDELPDHVQLAFLESNCWALNLVIERHCRK